MRLRPRLALGLALVLVLAPAGCARLRPHRTPTDITWWQDSRPPALSLHAKADAYQRRVEAWHQLPDGMLRYRLGRGVERGNLARGNHADGPFFQGIYLASQSLRHAVTGDPAARRQVLLTLAGMELYAEVSGRPGLLARWFSPEPAPDDPRWLPSPTHPEYFWRSDVSKDQYGGFVHGLGVTLAVCTDPEIRARVTRLAVAVADHLRDNDLRIVDVDGEPTTYGNLRGRIWGVPIGVNALIALAAAKTAAVASGEPRHVAFYAELVERGYPGAARWAHVSLPGSTKRVNDNMAFLALYVLLLLEEDPELLAEYRRGARRTWSHVGEDRNAFFAFVYAVAEARLVDDRDSARAAEAARRGVEALREFPDEKIGGPVDLTRPGFAFPRSWLNSSKGLPRSREAVPLYLRPYGSNLWVSDPFRLADRLAPHAREPREFSGIDYLSAYWIGRFHGLVPAEDAAATRPEPSIGSASYSVGGAEGGSTPAGSQISGPATSPVAAASRPRITVSSLAPVTRAAAAMGQRREAVLAARSSFQAPCSRKKPARRAPGSGPARRAPEARIPATRTSPRRAARTPLGSTEPAVIALASS